MSKAMFCLYALLLLPGLATARRVKSEKGKDSTEAALLNRQTIAQQAMQQTEGVEKAGLALLSGIEAISAGVVPFMQDPPDITRGFAIFDEELWKVVKIIVDDETAASPEFEAAKAKWDTFFDVTPQVVENVKAFHDNGDTDALVRAIQSIVGVALDSTASALPEKAKYFDALGDFVDGLGDGWHLHAEGKTTEAVESIWKALKVAVDDIVPAHVADDETYKLVMGTIDGVVGQLSEHVLEYKRRILNSKVCYKRTAHRERTRPNECRPGFEWDQGNLCWPDKDHGADCWETCGQAGMCASYCGSGKACCRRGSDDDPSECKGATGFVDYTFTKGNSRDYHQCVAPAGSSLAQVTSLDKSVWGKKKQREKDYGTHESMCDPNSDYNEKNGRWCTMACKPGYAERSGQKCEQLCLGGFPADGMGVCGTTPGELSIAMAEMVQMVASGAIKTYMLIDQMHEKGVDAEKLSATINTFIEMGKPFARPMCPEQEEAAAAF